MHLLHGLEVVSALRLVDSHGELHVCCNVVCPGCDGCTKCRPKPDFCRLNN
jgi:hypothetical protein